MKCVCHCIKSMFRVLGEKNWVYTINYQKNPGAKPEKKIFFAEQDIFIGFEIDLHFS